MSEGHLFLVGVCLLIVLICGIGIYRSARRSRIRMRKIDGKPLKEWKPFLKQVTVFPLTETMIEQLCEPEPDRYQTISPGIIRESYLNMTPLVLTAEAQRWMMKNCGPWGQVPSELLPRSTKTGLPTPACVLWFGNPDDAFNFKMRYG